MRRQRITLGGISMAVSQGCNRPGGAGVVICKGGAFGHRMGGRWWHGSDARTGHRRREARAPDTSNGSRRARRPTNFLDAVLHSKASFDW